MAQRKKPRPTHTVRSDIALVRTYDGRRVDRVRQPHVDLNAELLAELRDTGYAGPVVWPVS